MLSHKPALTLLIFLLFSFSTLHLHLFSMHCPVLLPSWDLVSSPSSPSEWAVNVVHPASFLMRVFAALSRPPSTHCASSLGCCAAVCVKAVSPFSRDFSHSLLCAATMWCFISMIFLFFSVPGAHAFSFHLISMRRFSIWSQSPSVCYGLFYVPPCDIPILGRVPYALKKNELSSLWSEHSVDGEQGKMWLHSESPRSLPAAKSVLHLNRATHSHTWVHKQLVKLELFGLDQWQWPVLWWGISIKGTTAPCLWLFYKFMIILKLKSWEKEKSVLYTCIWYCCMILLDDKQWLSVFNGG